MADVLVHGSGRNGYRNRPARTGGGGARAGQVRDSPELIPKQAFFFSSHMGRGDPDKSKT